MVKILKLAFYTDVNALSFPTLCWWRGNSRLPVIFFEMSLVFSSAGHFCLFLLSRKEYLARKLPFTPKLFSKVETGATWNFGMNLRLHFLFQSYLVNESKHKLAWRLLMYHINFAGPTIRSVGSCRWVGVVSDISDPTGREKRFESFRVMTLYFTCYKNTALVKVSWLSEIYCHI